MEIYLQIERDREKNNLITSVYVYCVQINYFIDPIQIISRRRQIM